MALGDSVYLWNAADGGIKQLMQTAGDGSQVTSIAWMASCRRMAVGTSGHEVQLWDAEKCQLVRSLPGHCARVGSLAWNGDTLTSGSRDASIVHHDVRAPQPVATLHGHQQEVCGLRWATGGGVQLASGGNDNLLNVWDHRRSPTAPPLHSFSHHTAAVKALAWCPWQKHLLASGGGTADRMIRFWNTSSGSFLNAVDTHSQERGRRGRGGGGGEGKATWEVREGRQEAALTRVGTRARRCSPLQPPLFPSAVHAALPPCDRRAAAM